MFTCVMHELVYRDSYSVITLYTNNSCLQTPDRLIKWIFNNNNNYCYVWRQAVWSVYSKSIGVSVNQSFLVYDSYTQLYNDRVAVYVTMYL